MIYIPDTYSQSYYSDFFMLLCGRGMPAWEGKDSDMGRFQNGPKFTFPASNQFIFASNSDEIIRSDFFVAVGKHSLAGFGPAIAWWSTGIRN